MGYFRFKGKKKRTLSDINNEGGMDGLPCSRADVCGAGGARALCAIPHIIVQMGWGDQTLLRARTP